MSLDITKLENARERSGKIIARCPACAEAGHDRKGEHLVVNEDGRFGCILYPGDSPQAKEHRRRIFALYGDQTTKPLAVHLAGTARTPFDKSHAYSCNKQGGLLKRLGRLFSAREQKHIYDLATRVPDVPKDAQDACSGVIRVFSPSRRRKLKERTTALYPTELDWLGRWCKLGGDPAPVLDAVRLFNAKIIRIEPSNKFVPHVHKKDATEGGENNSPRDVRHNNL